MIFGRLRIKLDTLNHIAQVNMSFAQKLIHLKHERTCRFSYSFIGKSRQVIIFQLHCNSLLSGKEEASIMNDTKWKCRYPCRHRCKEIKNETNFQFLSLKIPFALNVVRTLIWFPIKKNERIYRTNRNSWMVEMIKRTENNVQNSHRTIIEMRAVWIHTRAEGKTIPKTIHRRLRWSTVNARLTNRNGILSEHTHRTVVQWFACDGYETVLPLVLRNHRLRTHPLRTVWNKTKHKRPITTSSTLDTRAWAKNATARAHSTAAMSEILGFELHFHDAEKRLVRELYTQLGIGYF